MPTSIRPKGKSKDIFENIMNPEKNDKDKTLVSKKSKSKKKKKKSNDF